MARLALLLGLLQPATASFWTVTSYFVPTTSLQVYPSGCTESCRSTYTYTTTMQVAPDVTPTAKPTSSRTSTQRYYDLEVVSLFLEPGSVPESDLYDPYATAGETTTTAAGSQDEYAVPITYTAPSSCPTAFTVVTHTRVFVPSAVTALLKPTSTATSVYTRRLTSSEHTYVTKFLDPTALPSTMLPVATSGFDYSYYISNCRNPTATGAAYYGPSGSGSGSGSGSSSSGSSRLKVCSFYYGCTDLSTWVIVLAAVLPSLFVLGFLESFFWFRRLMTGKQALRFGTVCWCLISLWVTCFTRSQNARSPEDQQVLLARWKEMKAGRKLKLWFKWGFRHRYPVELLGDPGIGGSGPAAAAVRVVTVVVDEQGRPVEGQNLPPDYNVVVAGPHYVPAAAEKGDVGNNGGNSVNADVVPPAPPPAAHVAGQEVLTGGQQQPGNWTQTWGAQQPGGPR